MKKKKKERIKIEVKDLEWKVEKREGRKEKEEEKLIVGIKSFYIFQHPSCFNLISMNLEI